MASSSLHSVVTILFVLVLASSSLSVLQARMVPGDHDHAPVKEGASNPTASTVSSTVPSSRDLLAIMAPPPMALPTPASVPDMTSAVVKRWGKVQVQGSVPSPGIGH
ncbi:hypothetical protein ABZP36_014469 [Zizania latifolia]